jgi:hypothetical protein
LGLAVSVHVTSWVFKHSEESTPGRRLVLLILADHADNDGRNAYPSVATIAREARMSERGVRYALRELEASGQIRALGIHPQLRTTEYQVLMGQRVPGGQRVQGGQPLQGAAPDSSKGGQMATDQVSQIAPEPSLKPSEEPPTSEGSAHARANELPPGFPVEFRPHAERACAILRDVAEQHNAREVTLRGVGLAIMGNPGRRFVAVAYELASWAQTGRRIRDAVGTYRTFLGRADVFAGVEQFDTVPDVMPFAARPRRGSGDGWTASDILSMGRAM